MDLDSAIIKTERVVCANVMALDSVIIAILRAACVMVISPDTNDVMTAPMDFGPNPCVVRVTPGPNP